MRERERAGGEPPREHGATAIVGRPGLGSRPCCGYASSASSASSSTGGELDAPASRRARSLLAWLAYHPGLHPRARVAAVFWPDVLDEQRPRQPQDHARDAATRASGRTPRRYIVAGRDRVGIEDLASGSTSGRSTGSPPRAGGDEALALCRRRPAHRPRRRLGAGGAPGPPRPRRRAARGARRGGRGGRRCRGGRASRPPPARARPRLRGRRPRPDAAPRASGRRRRGRRRIRGVPRRAAGASSAWRRRPTPARWSRSCARARPPRAEAARRSRCRTRSPAPTAGRSSAATSSSRRCERPGERASAGAGGVVALAGEAGSGKTRLLAELAAEVREAGATVLAGRCIEDGVVPFAPFTEALRPYVAATLGERFPSGSTAELARLLPELGAGAAARGGRAARCAPPPVRGRGRGGRARRPRPPGAARRRGPALGGRRRRSAAGPRRPDGRVGAAARGRLAARRATGPRASVRSSATFSASGASSASCSAGCRRARSASWSAHGSGARRAAGPGGGGPPAHARQPALRRGARRAISSSRTRPAGRGAGRRRGGRGAARRQVGDRPPPGPPRATAPAAPCGRRRSPARTSCSLTSPRPAAQREERAADAPRCGGRAPGSSTSRRDRRALSLRARAGPRGGARRPGRDAPRAPAPADGRGARRCPSGRERRLRRAGAAPAGRPPAGGRRDGRGGRACAPPGARPRELAYEDAAELLERALAGDLDVARPAAGGAPARARRCPVARRRRAGGWRALRRGRGGRPQPRRRRSCSRARRSGARA